MSIKTKDYRFLKNGKYHLILSGEIHYFRLPKELWITHLDLAKSMGLNTIATYVPWLIHEEIYRQYDFTNDYDLAYFLSLCKERNLDVIIKPGPFVMAEIKNEGLPYWLYERFPEIIVQTWDSRLVSTPVVDYLHPAFLKEVNLWYNKLFDEIKDYIICENPTVVGIQLDNEVGMLSWVSNQPELTPSVISELNKHLPKSFDSLVYHDKLEDLMRIRYDTYIQTLKSFMTNLGINETLFFINIHGSSNSRGKTFPIGISQLINTYNQDDDILPGMDLYFGNIELENFHDLYIVNSFVKSTTKDIKPYGTLELNVADGNFGDNLALHYLPSSIDFKIRFALIQDQKFLNYYLLSAGINPLLKEPRPNDNNLRTAITGARHGFAAPIQVDGSVLYTFDKMKQTTQMIHQFDSYLASMKEQTDDIAACFMMESYKTEYQKPGDDMIRERNDNLSLNRNSVYWDTLLKHMLLLHYRFNSFWIENQKEIPSSIKLLMTNSSTYMSKENQEKLVNYLKTGGKIIFVGDLPIYNLVGEKETYLIDYLKISPIKKYVDWNDHLLTLTSPLKLYGQSEFRSFIAQSIKTDESALYKHLITGEKIGIKADQYVWITSNYPGHLMYTKDILEHLSISPKLYTLNQKGLLLTFKQTYQKTSLYHIINLEHFKQSFKLIENGKDIFDNHLIDINSNEALMLWTDLQINDEVFIYSTAEIQSFTKNSYTLNINNKQIYLKIKTSRKLIESIDFDVSFKQGVYDITIHKNLDQITLYFE